MGHHRAIPIDGIISVEGIVIPDQWDSDGNAVAVLLATAGEEEFELAFANAQAVDLQQLVRKNAVVTGRLSTRSGKTGRIDVSQVMLVTPPSGSGTQPSNTTDGLQAAD